MKCLIFVVVDFFTEANASVASMKATPLIKGEMRSLWRFYLTVEVLRRISTQWEK